MYNTTISYSPSFSTYTYQPFIASSFVPHTNGGSHAMLWTVFPKNQSKIQDYDYLNEGICLNSSIAVGFTELI
jgi:hypothetical protein